MFATRLLDSENPSNLSICIYRVLYENELDTETYLMMRNILRKQGFLSERGLRHNREGALRPPTCMYCPNQTHFSLTSHNEYMALSYKRRRPPIHHVEATHMQPHFQEGLAASTTTQIRSFCRTSLQHHNQRTQDTSLLHCKSFYNNKS